MFTTDYSVDSLAKALEGQDAVISLLGLSAIGDQQYALIDAAVKAGVKRFLPSEFGLDTASEKVLEVVPPFRTRKDLIETLKTNQAKGSGIEWTAFVAGLFLDWGLVVGSLGIDVKGRKADIWDEGDVPFTASTLTLVARTTVKLLTDKDAYEASRNAYIYTGSVTTTQNEVLAAAEKATGEKFQVNKINGKELIDESNAKIAKGDYAAMLPLVQATGIYRFGGEALHDFRLYGLFNERFGITEGSTDELVAEVVKKWDEWPYNKYVAPSP